MSLPGINSKVLKNGDPEPAAPAPGTFRFYNMRFCPWAQRPLIYAAKKEIPSEVINIHLKEKPDWYFKKHYKGQVPTLEHDGKYIIESAVIPEYLDDIFPETRILPTDPFEKVQQKLLLDRLGATAQALFGYIGSASDPSVKEEKLAALGKAFDDAEKLLEHEFFSGKAPGYVDYLIFPNIQRAFWSAHVFPELPLEATNFPGTARYPKLTEWYAKVNALPEVVAASQTTENGVAFFKEYVKGNPNYDYGL